MCKRVYFPLVILFWVIMNVLLWRSEMSSRGGRGSVVPASMVWERILTAPDESPMLILYQGHKIGYCRWTATIGGADVQSATNADTGELEGRVRKPTGYTLELEGGFLLPESSQRLRFNWRGEFDPNEAWRLMQFRVNLKPNVWEVRANAAAETVAIRANDSHEPWERTFTFAELARPERLLAASGLLPGYGWLSELMQTAPPTSPVPLAWGLAWEARSDRLSLGHSPLRVHRLQTRLFDKYQAVVYVSRVGEILRVELPYDVVLVNEAIATFQL